MEAKQQVIDALRELGGVKWLKKLARTHPQSFAYLVSRLMPTAVDVTAHGDLRIRFPDLGKLDSVKIAGMVQIERAAAIAGRAVEQGRASMLAAQLAAGADADARGLPPPGESRGVSGDGALAVPSGPVALDRELRRDD